jgi:hypothetical protein
LINVPSLVMKASFAWTTAGIRGCRADRAAPTYAIIKRYTPAVVAAALLPGLILAGFRWWSRPDLGLLAATVLIASVANAVVCAHIKKVSELTKASRVL